MNNTDVKRWFEGLPLSAAEFFRICDKCKCAIRINGGRHEYHYLGKCKPEARDSSEVKEQWFNSLHRTYIGDSICDKCFDIVTPSTNIADWIEWHYHGNCTAAEPTASEPHNPAACQTAIHYNKNKCPQYSALWYQQINNKMQADSPADEPRVLPDVSNICQRCKHQRYDHHLPTAEQRCTKVGCACPEFVKLMAIEQKLETGRGGREMYLDSGEHRMIVRQFTAIKSDVLKAPSITQSHSISGDVFDAVIVRDLFDTAINIAEQWAKDIGTEWKAD